MGSIKIAEEGYLDSEPQKTKNNNGQKDRRQKLGEILMGNENKSRWHGNGIRKQVKKW